MSGKSITQQQVKLYMSYRKNHSQVKSGVSERSARRIEKGEHQTQPLPRKYCTRKEPFNGLFNPQSEITRNEKSGLNISSFR